MISFHLKAIDLCYNELVIFPCSLCFKKKYERQVVISVYLIFGLFPIGWSQYSCLNTALSPRGYVACFLSLSFDVLSVIFMLHKLRPPYKIPFYLVLSIVFSFREQACFLLGAIRRFSWNDTWCCIEDSLITTVSTHLWMFKNPNFWKL